ncbi:tyrosyl-tRNA deacylase [Rhizobium helianthi]|uniref:Tyrosyl-tRNA deacylase n=1 Tax=Rhizobium helianthi TaxID=1132695 RepID=A0ABW4LYA4_9HYPH
MTNVIQFESREAAIDQAINAGVEAIIAQPKLELPQSDSPMVQSYVDKIQGTYNVERAKRDTDNAIDLLYIAYNTTPQTNPDVRVSITSIMNKLIALQQKSELTMRGAMKTANSIGKELGDAVPDWLDIKEAADQTEIKGFLSKDVVKIAKKIRDQALKIRDDLLAIAKAYDEVIIQTVQTTAKTETALGEKMMKKEQLQKEINETNARRAQLETLVADLTAQVANFEKKAREYEQKANTAEERAFVMSIVRMGAQLISNAIPAVAAAAGGPATMIMSAMAGSMGGQGKPAGNDFADPSNGNGNRAPQNAGAGNAKDIASQKTKLSEEQGVLKRQEALRDEQKTQLAEVKSARDKIAADETAKVAGSPKAVELAEFDKRIADNTAKLEQQERVVADKQSAVSQLQAAIDALDKGLETMSQRQQDQADTLRNMQMQMIERAEAYEKERRNQASELVKLSALLVGKRQEEDNLELCVRSLGMSITALKRMKEIVEEMAFFFKNFADFMQCVADDAGRQVTAIEDVAETEVIRKHRFAQLIRSVDEFFIKQTAQWFATGIVCDRFTQSFADGWTKLNKLSGDYLTGERLTEYLNTAANKISEIVAERQAAADAKIATLNDYRNKVSKQA